MPTTERTWAERAEALPGWRVLRNQLVRRRMTACIDESPETLGIIAAHCMNWSGWLCGIDHRPGEPGTHRARYLLPEPDGRMGVTPLGGADTAVHAIILAAEARHRVDLARGWC